MRIYSLILLLTISYSGFSQTLISKVSTWKYEDSGTNLGTAWRPQSYNDAAWASGNGVLGFGDGQNTVLASGYNTYYFRRTFNITSAAAVDALQLNLLRDDGAVVYINGQEVLRDNMPVGTIDYNTISETTISGADESTYYSFVWCNSGILVDGSNTIAVEVHQRGSISSDLSFDLELKDISGNNPSIVRGPYLQLGTPTSVIVRWRTDATAASIVRYGSSPGNLSQTINAGGCTTEHEVQITGLLPNTTYYYELQSSMGTYPNQSNQQFTTSPVTGTRQTVRAWILGDCGTGNADQRNVRDAYYNYASNQHTDMVLFLGDNAYNDGYDNEYQNAIFQNMYEDMLKKTVSWSTLGNHDGHSADAANQTGAYFDIFNFPKNAEAGGVASGTEAYYSFDYGNIHFIVLESYETDRSTSGAMYAWCENDIQNNSSDWVVAIWHHPPYTQGSHLSDIETELVQMRQNFLPMLEDNGVDLVLSGHSHSYERSRFLNGHYGLSLTFNSNNHTVGPSGADSGKENGTGAYIKETTGAAAGKGAVYITTGSAGKTSGGILSHPAMYASLNELGSCVLEVNRDTLRVKFVRETGAFDDYFTIIKNDVIPVEITVTNTPANATLTCGQNTSPSALGSLQAFSNCSTSSNVVINHNDVSSPGSCANNYFITRTWTATDLCGNQLKHIQTIVVQDNTPPTLTCNVAVDTVYMADTAKYLPNYASQALSFDFCTNNPAILQTPAPGATLVVGNQNILLYSKDACGNADSCWVQLAVIDSNDVGIQQSWLKTIQVYPNPSYGQLTVSGITGAEITIYSTDSKVLKLIPSSSLKTSIDLSNLKPGIYLVQIKMGDAIRVEKIVLL